MRRGEEEDRVPISEASVSPERGGWIDRENEMEVALSTCTACNVSEEGDVEGMHVAAASVAAGCDRRKMQTHNTYYRRNQTWAH